MNQEIKIINNKKFPPTKIKLQIKNLKLKKFKKIKLKNITNCMFDKVSILFLIEKFKLIKRKCLKEMSKKKENKNKNLLMFLWVILRNKLYYSI